MAKKKTIFLSGGGTLGSVMPLLALWEKLRDDYTCVWVGSFKGIEKKFVKEHGIRYLNIPSGKLRRYFSVKNFLTPIYVWLGLKSSFVRLLIEKPKLVIVSGSFISVPLVWASFVLRIPVIIHQEDIHPGLAGKLTFRFAKAVTTAFAETKKFIKNKNIYWLGNPVREIFYNALKKTPKKNTSQVLFLGGGLGSEILNKSAVEFAKNNPSIKVIDITGKGKSIFFEAKNYTQYEQLEDKIASVMAGSDVVVSRAGLSALSELSVLKKPSILVPLERVGQDKNADYFEKRKAAIVVKEKEIDNLEKELLELLKNKQKQKKMGQNIQEIFPPDAKEEFIKLIKKTIR